MLFTALITAAGFLLGLRAGLAIGYRAERGRRIISERKWLTQLSAVIGARAPELESIETARARLLEAARPRAPEGDAPQT